MSAPSLTDQFQHAAASGASEFELALLVAQVVDPEVDPAAVRSFVDRLAQGLAGTADLTAESLLEVFIAEGFGQSSQTAVGLQHSNLAWVVAHRQGIPISLAVLLIETARRCGLSGHGVNFPGHFLVSINDRLVDPLRMQVIDPAQLSNAKIDEAQVQRLLNPASPQMVGLRMLNNIKALHLNTRDWARALDQVDYQLALCAGEAELCASLHFERGEYWQQLGAIEAARDAYNLCAELSQTPKLIAQARQQAQSLSGRGEVLH